MTLPPPSCRLGYPEQELRELLGDFWPQFDGWMFEGAECEGHGCKKIHGRIYPEWEVELFLETIR